MKTVEIEIADDGTITVGEPPQAEEMGHPDMQEDKSYMQPVANLDDALSQAKDILTGAQDTNTSETRASIAKEVWK